MKTEQITVASNGSGIDNALALTEKLGVDAGLDRKPVLHLRLLAEELFGMLRGIAGDVEADYWIDADGRKFELHMKSDVAMTDAMRTQFLAASKSGKNAAEETFTGKIRVMIADMLLSAKEVLPYAMINAAAAYNPAIGATGETAYIWTMSAYRDEVMKNIDTDQQASDAWDQLEKSIVANISDDIRVSIAGSDVEITVYKNF